MNNARRTLFTFLALGLALGPAFGLAACQAGAPGRVQSALGSDDGGARFENAPEDQTDPFAAQSAPLAVTAHMHSCQRLPYATLGTLLASRGVDLSSMAPNGQPPTAGQLYKMGASTLGAPDYATRTRESIEQTTSGATKLMDVFLMAAPEIIAAMPGLAACQVGGKATAMFDPQTGLCTREGVMCLTGTPPPAAQVDLCNQLLKDVPDATGRQIAVAAILSAAHTCE